MNRAIDTIILDLFISPGEYTVLNDCSIEFEYYILHFNKNDLFTIRVFQLSYRELCDDFLDVYFSSDFGIGLFKNGSPEIDFFDSSSGEYFFYIAYLINNLLPNIKKLSPDELIIRDIIT
jgi:hypothetical protein